LHDRGDDEAADHQGVEEDRHGQTEPELLQEPLGAEQEATADHHHDRRHGGDHPPGGGQALPVGAWCVADLLPLLVHAGEQEHPIVHREPEHDGEDHHRDERLDRPRLHAEHALLEHQRDGPQARATLSRLSSAAFSRMSSDRKTASSSSSARAATRRRAAATRCAR
jgi:hypothetical protein